MSNNKNTTNKQTKNQFKLLLSKPKIIIIKTNSILLCKTNNPQQFYLYLSCVFWYFL